MLSYFVSPLCMLAEVSYIYYYGIGSHESVGMYLCYDGAEFRRTRNNEEKWCKRRRRVISGGMSWSVDTSRRMYGDVAARLSGQVFLRGIRANVSRIGWIENISTCSIETQIIVVESQQPGDGDLSYSMIGRMNGANDVSHAGRSTSHKSDWTTSWIQLLSLPLSSVLRKKSTVNRFGVLPLAWCRQGTGIFEEHESNKIAPSPFHRWKGMTKTTTGQSAEGCIPIATW